MASQLVAAMARLHWPRSLLDIKFICEAGDSATIAALAACRPGAECEVVIVPPLHPMTKPKALQYALQGARGSLVAVYDAEDVPHPAQLLEAHAAFALGGGRLACVQAPLAIANSGRNWITTLFALEYAGLFRMLIPFLDRHNLPILLGGTSNHFRREALIEVGGWDPYNVTEDADLGMRLYRRGFRTKAIWRATVESAPQTLAVWIRQRSRWYKGWTQTWLVLMRQPIRLARELGPVGFITFQLLLAGMLVSAAIHPMLALFLLASLYLSWQGAVPPGWDLHAGLFAIDLFNVTASYLVFLCLGWRGMAPAEKARIPIRGIFLLPAYWIAMSVAAWRAVIQLPFKPHLWEKTPHPAQGRRRPPHPAP
ncbi:cellulose synthase/poly-beta-1,6-N-acetylglucosamine synthase-like glycosyltransferase [Hoeflea marina]|uniref:Cellulose synthase/poly-beta-1,6-N-acetylglucosamine synthase-like glycosyltransferase n=1 Tax=Hoeflea marina TaxID=274592 RepID=A0A317PGZ8_9HYPH|nr:glycosyltransferase family 2 protein [Hoeflea marina]PWV99898.1 cellulose synthase/poly-beta-1,6-N-acetylglucosamine synthase-like glycosyltransferase [Hoeflea marina]